MKWIKTVLEEAHTADLLDKELNNNGWKKKKLKKNKRMMYHQIENTHKEKLFKKKKQM